MSGLTWTCFACGDVHPIDHAGMWCSACQTIVACVGCERAPHVHRAMRIPAFADDAERDAHRRAERALLRSAALQAGIIAGVIPGRARRIAAARVALVEAADELVALRERNTTWILAMHRARCRQIAEPSESRGHADVTAATA